MRITIEPDDEIHETAGVGEDEVEVGVASDEEKSEL